MNLSEFGLYFAELREKSGYSSQRQLAQKSGISNGTIARIESGVQKATPETLIALAKCLDGNPYFHFLTLLGYIDIEDAADHEYLIHLEKYRALVFSLQLAYKVLLSDQLSEKIKQDFILEAISQAEKRNISLSLEQFIEDPKQCISQILKKINLEHLDVTSSIDVLSSDKYVEIDRMIGENTSYAKELELIEHEKKKLANELETEILEKFNKNFLLDDLSKNESVLINEVVRKALISERTGKGKYYLQTYLDSFKNDEVFNQYAQDKKNEELAVFEKLNDYIAPEKFEFFNNLEKELGLDLSDPEVQKKLKRAAKIIFSDED